MLTWVSWCCTKSPVPLWSALSRTWCAGHAEAWWTIPHTALLSPCDFCGGQILESMYWNKNIYIYICRTIKSVQFILYYIAVVCFCIKLFQFCGRNFTLVSIEYSQEQSSSLSNVGSCLIHVLLYRGITVYGNWKPLVKYIYMNECKWKLEGCSAWNNVKCQLDATR